MAPGMYRVLLVDDHEVVRKGLRAILDDRFAGIEVAEAGSGDEALAAPERAVRRGDPRPVDARRSGLDLLSEIKHRHPRLPVLILSLYGEEQFAVRALRAGAAGYLTKSRRPSS